MTESWALFFDTDDEPHFGVELCDEGSLLATVHKVMFTGEPTEDTKRETAEYVAGLYADGDFIFEDGWIALRKGVGPIVEFIMAKAKDIAEDRVYEDSERARQHKRADDAEAALSKLRATLRELLAPQATAILAATV